MTDGVNMGGIIETTKGGPQLDPSTTVAIANSGVDVSQLRNLAAGVQAYGNAQKFRAQLEDQDPAVQSRLWRVSNPSGRNLLAGVGYKPPQDPEAHKHSKRGLFDTVLHSTAGAIGGAVGWVGQTAGHETSRELHNLGAPLRASQHLLRTTRMIDEENFMNGHGGLTLHGAFSPGVWAKAWQDTSVGEKTFSPIEEAKARQRWDDSTVDLAKMRASGMTDTEVALAHPEAQRLDLMRRMHDDPNLHDATEWMKASHLTLGHIIVPTELAISKSKIHLRIPTPWDPMGHKYTLTGADLHQIMTGGIDATYDWYADPLVIGGKAVKGIQEARYGLRTITEGEGAAARTVLDANDIARKAEMPGVKRELEKVAGYIARPKTLGYDSGHNLVSIHTGVAALQAEQPRWANVAEQLAHEKIDTADKLVTWLQGEAGQSALLQGRLAGMHTSETVMPFSTVIGDRLNWLKNSTRHVIDWTAEKGPWGTRTAGKFQQTLLNSTTRAERLRAFAPNAPAQFMAEARMYLPESRARELTGLFMTSKDPGTKLNVYRGMLDELRQASGMSESNPFWQNLVSQLDDASGQIYSNGQRELLDNQAYGFLENHFTTGWRLPSYKQWLTAARKSEMMGHPIDLADKLMNVWRPSVLLRPAFALRAGGEELVEAMIRHTPKSMIQARLATSSAKGADVGLLPYHPLRATFERLSKDWPSEIYDRVKTPSDFVGAHLGMNARRAFRNVEGRLAGEEYLNAAKDLAKHPEMTASIGRQIFASESSEAGFGNVERFRKTVVRDGIARQVWMEPTGQFAGIERNSANHAMAWQYNMQEFANSGIGQKALEVYDLPREQQIQKIADFIASPEMKDVRERAVRNYKLPDGRMVSTEPMRSLSSAETPIGDAVGAGLATQREAHEAWADVVVGHMDEILRSEDGVPLHNFVERLKVRDVPSLDDIKDLPVNLKPFRVKGPDYIEIPRHTLRALVDRGFSEMVGRPMDWIVREPLFLHNYAGAMKKAELLKVFNFDEEARREWAIHKAVDDTIPFIHDPRLRSQFSLHTRNLAPFWFAQEQFYKRVARTAAWNPAGIRQAQLVMQGIRHTGVLHQDQNGEDYLMIPGVEYALNAIANGVSKYTGVDARFPMPVGFSGQVKMASPGLERLGLPSVGPLLGVPVRYVTQRFPELQPLEPTLLGERGTGRSYWEMITPSTISRIVHGMIDKPETSVQMTSAMTQAMQYLEYAGLAPDDTANAHEVQVYQDRVREWTRAIFFTRAVFGFGSPTSPQAELDPKHFNARLHELMGVKGITYQQAVGEFIRENPDATSYTVFPTTSASGAPLPATAKALKFMENNRSLLLDYPKGGGWLLPGPPNPKDKFVVEAYREQLALALRTRKLPEEFYDDLKFGEAAPDYFDTREGKDARLAAAKGNSALTKQINDEWKTWKDQYLNVHRIFKERLADPKGATRRADVLDELTKVFADPRTPKSPQISKLKDFVDTFKGYRQRVTELRAQRGTYATMERQQETAIFNDWAKTYVDKNPGLANFYNSVIRPEVEIHG